MNHPLREIALEYHFRTEEYDRMVCSGGLSKYGCAMPSTPEESRLINNNAINERGVAISRGKKIGFSAADVGRAISDFALEFNYEHEKEKRRVPDALIPKKGKEN